MSVRCHRLCGASGTVSASPAPHFEIRPGRIPRAASVRSGSQHRCQGIQAGRHDLRCQERVSHERPSRHAEDVLADLVGDAVLDRRAPPPAGLHLQPHLAGVGIGAVTHLEPPPTAVRGAGVRVQFRVSK